MVSCTVVSNLAYYYGGVSSSDGSASSIVQNSMITGNRALANFRAPDLTCSGMASQGRNLFGSTYGFTVASNDTVSGANPLIAPLANNGGPTLTHALLPGSPTLDAGDDSLTGTDQRGFPRLSGAHVDIGAFEFGVPVPQPLTWLRRVTNSTYQFTCTNFSDVPAVVLASTNVALPWAQWTSLGSPTLLSNSLYQFTDTSPTNNLHRFYRLRWP